ncbi:MAG TPA: MFS transporter, partial [Acidimicrobiales bacterium]|nr:MFS transporter [Acidimicrobiales bacterium]
ISHSMIELIVFRAVQGLGGGGLFVGAQTIVGDIVSPRERGRYMGLFMAMFGVTTVLGPLVGGLFVDYASWRWIFYINIPIGIIALFVTAATLPAALSRVKRVIDYLGTLLMSGAATALVLFTSLGGTSYAWGSPFMIGLAVAGGLLTLGWVFAERRAAEPVIPLHLFANKVFSAASAIGFVVGFAMFGGMSFLPLYFQVVKGVSPTASGVRLFPMMAGLLVASIASGQAVSRWGRYKVFPVVGSVLITLGLYLMSHIGVSTGFWPLAGFMAVFGVGLGLVMQVLVVSVQNAVSYEELGTATSGATFFRMIGGSFGTAVFGAIFANVLAGNLASRLHGLPVPSGVAGQIDNPKLIATLPPAARLGISQALASSIDRVFLVAVPIAAVAFLLSWLLPEIELRRSVRTSDAAAEGLAATAPASSLDQLRINLERIASRENRDEVYQRLADRAGVALKPQSTWLLYRVADHPEASLCELGDHLKLSPEKMEAGVEGLVTAGLVARRPGDGDAPPAECPLALTAAGDEAVEQLTDARRGALADLLAGWDLDDHPEVTEMVRDLAKALMADDARFLADARPAGATAASGAAAG